MADQPAGLVTIPARSGKAAFVKRGQSIRVVNTHGKQVVDTWAFNRDDLTEFMSMEHTRAHALTVFPTDGRDAVHQSPAPDPDLRWRTLRAASTTP